MLTILQFHIREQDPLKQGLKQFTILYCKISKFIREQDPLKQGLKHMQGSERQDKTTIREQDPLKQGLKPSRTRRSS